MNSVVSEASVLPPAPQPQQQEQPRQPPQRQASQQLTSSREPLSQRLTLRQLSSRQQQSPSVGYQGVSQSRRTLHGIKDEYPDVKVEDNGPTDTPLRKQVTQNPG